MRLGKVWAIPGNAEKPGDGGCKAVEARQNGHAPSVQSILHNEELCAKIIKHFPYPMHIAAPDGTLLEANEAFLNFFKVSGNDKIFRKHNVLQDPDLEKWGIREHVAKAFQGEIVQVYDIKVPVQDLVKRFSNRELAFEEIYQNITSFPIYGDTQKIECVVTVFITSRLYIGQEAIIKGKEFIDTHWKDKYDIDKIAAHVYMSKYYFTRQFKKHVGMTPYAYYQEMKLEKLKEKLCNKNISVSQAFAECGLDYSGYFSKLFKEKVGMTPSQYKSSEKQ
jgi:AraC-like DNA-binding protein